MKVKDQGNSNNVAHGFRFYIIRRNKIKKDDEKIKNFSKNLENHFMK